MGTKLWKLYIYKGYLSAKKDIQKGKTNDQVCYLDYNTPCYRMFHVIQEKKRERERERERQLECMVERAIYIK